MSEKLNLVDVLKKDSPDLAKDLENIGSKLAILRAYKTYLYRSPSEEEISLPPEKRTNWNNMCFNFEEQPYLEKCLNALESKRRVGDKVVVVTSKRPFFDTLLDKCFPEEPTAWIGNFVNQEFKKQDAEGNPRKEGTIYRKISLENAKPLRENQLRSLVESELTRQMLGNNAREPFDNAIESLNKLSLGNKKIEISEPYHHTDVFCIEQVFTDIEKRAMNLDLPELISLKDKCWKTDVPDRKGYSGIGCYGRAEIYLDSTPWQLALLGEDKRSPEEIFLEIQNIYEKYYTSIKNELKAEEIKLYILKKMQHNLTKEDQEEIESSFYKDGVLNLKLMEKGYDFSDKTLIFLSVSKNRSGMPAANIPFTHELQETVLNNYKMITFGGSYGESYDDYSKYHKHIHLHSLYFFEIDQYFGEIAKTPYGRQEFIKEHDESMKRFEERRKQWAELENIYNKNK
ncbi:MAG: hypothetical protein PHU51_01270 [Candidatus Nanoarchaeia archaeon]|nr:hypothetical protein [Candidatus Nanoarchaeia archaeon]